MSVSYFHTMKIWIYNSNKFNVFFVFWFDIFNQTWEIFASCAFDEGSAKLTHPQNPPKLFATHFSIIFSF